MVIKAKHALLDLISTYTETKHNRAVIYHTQNSLHHHQNTACNKIMLYYLSNVERPILKY